MIQFKKLATTVVLDAVAKLLAGLTTIVLIRQLSSQELGYYGLALATTLIVYQVVIYTLNQYELVTRLQRNLNLFLLQIAISLALIIYLSPSATGILSILTYFLGIVIVDSARLNRHLNNQYISFSMIEFFRNLFIFLSIYYLSTAQHLSVELVFYVQGGSGLLFFGTLFLKGLPRLNQNSSSNYSWKSARPTLALFFYFMLVGFIGQIEPLALNKFSSQTELTHFTVSQRLYVVMTTVLASINSVYLAESSYQNDLAKLTLQLHKHLKFMALLVVPTALVALIFGKPAYELIVTPSYSETYSTFCVLTVLALIGLMFSPFVNLCILRKQYSFLLKLTSISLLINFLLNATLTAKYGSLGASLILLLTTAIINFGIITKHFLTKDVKIN